MNKYAATLLLSFLPHLVWGQSFSIPYSKNKTLEYTGKELPTYLSFDARIDTAGKYTGGGANALLIKLNGYALQAEDLANKKNDFLYGKYKMRYVTSSGQLFLPYAPWAKAGQKQRIIQRYTFYIKPFAKKSNTLELANIYSAVKNSSVEIRNLVWHNAPEQGKYVNNAQSIKRLAAKINIPLGKKHCLSFYGNKQRYLAFAGKITTNKWKSGAQPALVITVNGVPLRSRHLVNKGAFFHFSSKHELPWVNGTSIVLGYYDWQSTRRTIDKEFIHNFVFDLKDLLLPNQNNCIEFNNIFAAFPNSSLDLQDIRLLAGKTFPVAQNITEKPVASYGNDAARQQAEGLHRGVGHKFQAIPEAELCRKPVNFMPQEPQVPQYTFDNCNGSFGLKFNDAYWQLNSSYKVKGEWFFLENNSLDSKYLKVRRQIKPTPLGIEISDTMTNLTQADLPVVYDHSFNLPLEKINEFRVAGEAMKNFSLSTNNLNERKYSQTPLFYLGMKECGLGIYILDDVFRNHYSAMAINRTLHLADDIFYLPPGKSYTVTIKLYPVKGNYYDCLNTLRKDLNLYQTIPALHGFIYKHKNSDFYDRYYRKELNTPDLIKRFFRDSGITAPALTGEPMLYGSEPDDVWQKAWEIPGKFKKAIRSTDLAVKTINHYCDVHLVATDGSKDKNAKSLWQERLADSVLKNFKGEPVPYVTNKLYHVVPTLENSAGKQIIRNLQTIWNQHPNNGIFFDEFNHSRARIAWNFSDNTSALLDKRGNIVRKFAMVPLYSQEFLLAISDMAIKHNLHNYANQFDCTLKLMQQKLIHFAEPVAQEESYLIRAAQASRTPLTLTCKRNTTAWSDIKYFLQYGVAVCYYATRSYGDHLLQKLYPLQVESIHPGIVYGKEKTLTLRSGKYTFPAAKKLTVYIYKDPDGMLAETRKIKGNTVELKLAPAKEVALITVQTD